MGALIYSHYRKPQLLLPSALIFIVASAITLNKVRPAAARRYRSVGVISLNMGGLRFTNNKIFRSIIKWITIDVVDNFGAQKESFEGLLHNQPVLGDVTSLSCMWMVSGENISVALHYRNSASPRGSIRSDPPLHRASPTPSWCFSSIIQRLFAIYTKLHAFKVCHIGSISATIIL